MRFRRMPFALIIVGSVALVVGVGLYSLRGALVALGALVLAAGMDLSRDSS
jgi:hypothetical protein